MLHTSHMIQRRNRKNWRLLDKIVINCRTKTQRHTCTIISATKRQGLTHCKNKKRAMSSKILCQIVGVHVHLVAIAAYAYSAMPHMLTLRSMRKYPSSPQSLPHEFLAAQNGTPDSLTPKPVRTTQWVISL